MEKYFYGLFIVCYIGFHVLLKRVEGNMGRYIWLVLVCCFLFVSQVCAMQNDSTLPKAPYVAIKTVRQWQLSKREFLLVDVRRPDEFKAGHLPGAINIPYDQVEKRKSEIPLDQPVVFYCTISSWRAPYAANVMADAGLNNVYILEGGASAWNAGGQEIQADNAHQKPVIVPKPKDLQPQFVHPPKREYKTKVSLTRAQLKEFDGKNGRPAYVAVGGVIYDLTLSRLWRGGEHDPSLGEVYAGKDLTVELDKSPHGDQHLKNFPIVGSLQD